MSYAIVGFGKIGRALAEAFARNGIEVSVATTRDPESLAADAAAIGPTIIPEKLAGAIKADIVFLAVRFESHPEVAKALPTWQGKIIVDVTNAYGLLPEELGGQPSSKFVAKAFAGGRLVKGFNHLLAGSSAKVRPHTVAKELYSWRVTDDAAAAEIGTLAEKLGFAPIQLGGLSEGGLLVHASGNSWGRLIFKDRSSSTHEHDVPTGRTRRIRSGQARPDLAEMEKIPMSTHKNVQTVKDFFATIGRGDRESLLALVAEDIEWIIPGEDWPLAGTHRGHAGPTDLLQTTHPIHL